MQITLNKINKELEIIADNHKQLQGYFFGDYFEALGNDKLEYPFVCVTPVSANPVVKQMQITLAIMIVDKYDEGSHRQKAEIWSDANLYFDDLKATFRSLRWTRYMSVEFGALEPLQNHEQDVTCGWIGNVTFNITDYEIFCRVPYDDYDFEADMNVTIDCESATWTLEDSQGNVLNTGTIASGGSATITAPDSSYTVEYANGDPITSGNIPSGGSETIIVPNCDQDLFLYFDYETGDDTVSITVDTNSAGTINTASTGSLTSVVYEVNATPVTLPFSISNGDTLEITFDAAAADGQIILSGTY